MFTWLKTLLNLTPQGTPPNCLNCYPRDMGGVKLEYMKNPVGPLCRSLNDSEWYYVHFWDKETESLQPPPFPDSIYASPQELAEVVEAAPLTDYYTRHNAMLEKLSPWFLVGSMGIMVLALIIFGGQ